MTRLLLAAYFLETGALLLAGPWSDLWDHNAFVAWVPAIDPWVRSAFVRGGVSGIGLVTIAAGLGEVGELLAARRASARAVSRVPAERP